MHHVVEVEHEEGLKVYTPGVDEFEEVERGKTEYLVVYNTGYLPMSFILQFGNSNGLNASLLVVLVSSLLHNLLF